MLPDFEPALLFIGEPFDGCIPQIDDTQRSANFLLRIQNCKVFQGGVVHYYVNPLSATIRGDQRDAATFCLCAGMRRFCNVREWFLVVTWNCHFGRHFGELHSLSLFHEEALIFNLHELGTSHAISDKACAIMIQSTRERSLYRERGRLGGDRQVATLPTHVTGMHKWQRSLHVFLIMRKLINFIVYYEV